MWEVGIPTLVALRYDVIGAKFLSALYSLRLFTWPTESIGGKIMKNRIESHEGKKVASSLSLYLH